ncbi:alpha/beta hydrolase [Coleofasciculus sp. FACHB-542]|nr:alpha/beta hydrolase [Coleofasciculus sp. FACHB-542]
MKDGTKLSLSRKPFRQNNREGCLKSGLQRQPTSPITNSAIKRLLLSLPGLCLGMVLPSVTALMPSRVLAAEKIFISYGPIQLSLPVSALEEYAREGKINQDLGFYAQFFKPEQLEQLRRILQTRANVSPVAVAQFLYTPQGEILLRRVGEIIQTKAFQPGFYAIRAALIQAAADPQGLTPLNVLRKFPTYAIRINSDRGFEIIDELSNLIGKTQGAIAAVEQEALAEISAQSSTQMPFQPSQMATPSNIPAGRDLQQPGPLSWEMQTLTLNDLSRSRTFPVDVYLPQLSGRAAPVIVISHGLGSDRLSYAYLARHLASHGFAVALPEHPGSNSQQLQALISGLTSDAAPPSEAVDRPLDMKYLLDQLAATYRGRLDMQNVGVLGQSFGGYTALALAGAEINFENLEKDCTAINSSLNLSLLLQCRALLLPQIDYQLGDDRIKAAIAINPVDSSIFGKSEMSGIKVPIMLFASSNDTAAPALSEQIKPFTWLTTPNKYLVLMKKATHFSTLGEAFEGTGVVKIPPQVAGPNPVTAFGYVKALSLAFFKTYVSNEPEYQQYLNASYAQYISRDEIPLVLIQSLTEEQLQGISNTSTAQPIPSPTPNTFQLSSPPALPLQGDERNSSPSLPGDRVEALGVPYPKNIAPTP